MKAEIINSMYDINFLIYLKDNVDIRIRGIGYLKDEEIKHIFFEDKNGRWTEEILNPYYDPKDVKLFDKMIEDYKSDNIIISEILKNNREALNYIIERDTYSICIEPYDIFGLYH